MITLTYEEEQEKLNLRISSFSFKKGYPEDLTGNGGGFVFDCRFLPNPGRFSEYKFFTGRDKQVIDFFTGKPEMEEFISRVREMVEPAVKNYIERGFGSLQVNFGCTGGQHRSVYCAERVGKLLAERFPEVNVEIKHREQSGSDN